jgi:hypothetical protein
MILSELRFFNRKYIRYFKKKWDFCPAKGRSRPTAKQGKNLMGKIFSLTTAKKDYPLSEMSHT